jgi:hypothetical protein
MVDQDNNVTTDFYLEPPGTPGPRESSAIRHLIARSSDGRPERAIAVPDDWSDEALADLVSGVFLPDSHRTSDA